MEPVDNKKSLFERGGLETPKDRGAARVSQLMDDMRIKVGTEEREPQVTAQRRCEAEVTLLLNPHPGPVVVLEEGSQCRRRDHVKRGLPLNV